MLLPARAADVFEGNRIAGIGFFCLATAFFSMLDTTAKFASMGMPVLQVIWLRYVAHFLLTALVFNPVTSPDAWRFGNRRLQIVRGVFLLGSTMCNFTALQYLQLDETGSIMFAAPLVVAILAIPILGEVIGPRRWTAIVFGFLGVLVVMRPGLGGLSWHALYSVAAVLFAALYAITTRQLAGRDTPARMLIVSAGVAVVLLAPAVPFFWEWPTTGMQWFQIFLMGTFGAVGHWFWNLAHRHAPAPILAPFVYVQILWMIGLGYIFFANVPTVWTLIGAAIVILSGLYLLARERRVAKT